MRYSGKQIVHPGVRARDLPALMELYELNYIQLRQLVPDVDAIPTCSVSVVKGVLSLHLTVLERSKYTTTLHLTYRFDDTGVECTPAPDLVVRTYHDAQVAEVISRGSRRGQQGGSYDRFRHEYPIEARWQVNRFFHKWLAYCLRQGHGFSPGRLQLSEAMQTVENEVSLSVES